MKLPNGIDTQGRPVAAIDWSRSKIHIKEADKKVASEYKSLTEAAPHYKGYIWAMESTVESFELQKRQEVLDAIAKAGIQAFCINPKYTSRYRIIWNYNKSDSVDAEVILRIFTETKLVWGELRQLVRKDTLRDTIKRRLVEDRYLYGSSVTLQTAIGHLPVRKHIPESYWSLILESSNAQAKNPKRLRPKKQIGRLLLAALEVRKAGLGWRTFVRQVGAYGQGYPCMLRSEYYHHLIRNIWKARLKAAGMAKPLIVYERTNPKNQEEKIKTEVWSPEQVAIRNTVAREMYHILKWLWRLTA